MKRTLSSPATQRSLRQSQLLPPAAARPGSPPRPSSSSCRPAPAAARTRWRALQGIVAKHNLMKQSIVPINKSGGAGAEGFLDVKGAKGDPHKIIITLSNLFTTPLATGVPFNWRDLTPVPMLALDKFVLWVNAEDALQDAPRNTSTPRRRPARASSRWAARAPSRKTRSSPSRSRGDRHQVHLHPVQGRRRRSRRSWSASTSTRR